MTSDTAPRPDVDPALRSRMRLYVVLLLAVVVARELELPFRLAALPFGIATMWVGVLLLVQLSRLARLGRKPRGQIAVSLGIGLVGVMMTVTLREAALYPLVSDHEACLAEAQTNTARKLCDDEAEERRREFFERLSIRRE